MNYEINVSLNGQHYFATHARSLRSENKAIEMAKQFQVLFPESDGYRVSLTEERTSGYHIDIS